MFKKVVHTINEYKILRGMISYSILWPIGNIVEQTLVEKKTWETYDWKKCLRCVDTYDTLFFRLSYVWKQ